MSAIRSCIVDTSMFATMCFCVPHERFRNPDRSLPYSQALPGGHFPAFNRYYEAAKTSPAASRQTSSFACRCLSKDCCFRSPCWTVTTTAPGRCSAGIVTFSGVFLEKTARDLPCPLSVLLYLCPVLRPRSARHLSVTLPRHQFCPSSL